MKRDKRAYLLYFERSAGSMLDMTELMIREVRAHSELPEPANARRIREYAGVSQARLARALGVHRATLSRWESGTTKPRPTRVDAYGTALAALQVEGLDS